MIQCLDDPSGFWRGIDPGIALVGDARVVSQQMVDRVREAGLRRSFGEDLRDTIAGYDPWREFKDSSTENTVDIRAAHLILNKILPQGYSIVTDVGRYMLSTWRFLRVPDPRQMFHASAFGSIGLGVAVAVGVAAADRERVTVCAVGDGGGMMGLLEFGTAVRHKLPMVMLVFNDGSYGFEYRKLAEYGKDPRHSLMEWPSFADVATALGGRGIRVRNRKELEGLSGTIWNQGELPLLVEIMADPSVETVP